nr:hypothetical protein Iba_chr08eCG0800 [Ipomoea batatas]
MGERNNKYFDSRRGLGSSRPLWLLRTILLLVRICSLSPVLPLPLLQRSHLSLQQNCIRSLKTLVIFRPHHCRNVLFPISCSNKALIFNFFTSTLQFIPLGFRFIRRVFESDPNRALFCSSLKHVCKFIEEWVWL